MDLFDKCYAFKRHEEVKAMGLYPYFQPIYENYGPIVKMDGREIVMAGSNNYLGLTTDPRVKEAAIEAIKKYGTGCSGSRYLNGTLDIHIKLEEQLAEFVGKESALLFSTGFQTNQGAIVPLIGKDDYVISDKDNHASIVQGTLISKGLWGSDVLVRYRHNDMQHLEEVISKLPLDAGKLIVTDGVFSMSGNIVNLPELVRIARKYNARIMLDDAHGLGVLGKGGRGTANHFGLDDQVDIIMGTFSKSFASLGGFIAGEKPVIDYIKHHSPALIFSASMTPPQVAAVLKALEIIKAEPERIERLHYNANKVRQGLKNLGFNVLDGQTPIVPVVIGDDLLTFKFWRMLFDNGVFVNAVISPAVPQGMQLLRLSFMATHEDKHLDFVIETFEKVGKELALID
ncbi:aminotransferase class I/II-fold pyridoxal phosphate-dependent enzyme [Candidatus Chrysopegis kryptomonas]|uniref:8-amino-7-oxononanoate synthase n=1 Tax=Candidatus Chryseopegocella kryptomonas TaxID=1633643 RepID=A0A0P1NYM7_9BACT|nr:aminotransferase class I/II-fold pyridoxal phosphate-dependent enzyme [Candidatus Chrysopegis kryptomonas]CUT04893.1 8-amino-7-oxononanoate synthase [Candidatus Chrysopegis kryptomonas]